ALAPFLVEWKNFFAGLLKPKNGKTSSICAAMPDEGSGRSAPVRYCRFGAEEPQKPVCPRGERHGVPSIA
ncbi:hypothetical protein, partial [Mesorhizobium sp. M7A.F.Ca.ET.027.03.2.1]|uniref:hypothetical protein n=1 Tax=Mesorhizobium sp. M7A.F.Ca.ET.027.03.2.1 TaxID=2496656 RepID=UPI001AECCC8E